MGSACPVCGGVASRGSLCGECVEAWVRDDMASAAFVHGVHVLRSCARNSPARGVAVESDYVGAEKRFVWYHEWFSTVCMCLRLQYGVQQSVVQWLPWAEILRSVLAVVRYGHVRAPHELLVPSRFVCVDCGADLVQRERAKYCFQCRLGREWQS